MKIDSHQDDEGFRPVTISLTLESQQEVNDFVELFGHNCTVASALVDASRTKFEYQRIAKFFSEIYQSIKHHKDY